MCYIKQIYTDCLSQASYYIESNGIAAVIDPMREPEPYLQLAKEHNAKITYIFETHFHADFVSGHIDLSKKTGAEIVFGPEAKPAYPAYIAENNEIFALGNVYLQLLHTPGHTIESSCILLFDSKMKELALFTGDTLFAGDVGRPDLLSGNKSKEELSRLLYKSINTVIKKLPSNLIVYPGHGSGSACGKNLGDERFTTIEVQKRTNYALQEMSESEFITAVSSNLPQPPSYFFKDAVLNKNGYKSLEDVLQNNVPLSILEFNKQINENAIIIDTRSATIFANGFIKNAINIGLKGEFAPWIGTLIDYRKKIILVCEPDSEKEAITRLARIGYDNIGGYLEGGFQTWRDAGLSFNTIETIEAEDYCFFNDKHDFISVDVRHISEAKKEHMKRALLIPLENLEKHLNEFDENRNYILFCVGGYRSMIAASILKSAGINNVTNVNGGIEKIKIYSPELVAHK